MRGALTHTLPWVYWGSTPVCMHLNTSRERVFLELLQPWVRSVCLVWGRRINSNLELCIECVPNCRSTDSYHAEGIGCMSALALRFSCCPGCYGRIAAWTIWSQAQISLSPLPSSVRDLVWPQCWGFHSWRTCLVSFLFPCQGDLQGRRWNFT